MELFSRKNQAVRDLAKLIMPGSDPGGFIVTICLGIAGSVLGGWLGRVLGLYSAGEPAGIVMAVAGAILLLLVYRFIVTTRTPG